MVGPEWVVLRRRCSGHMGHAVGSITCPVMVSMRVETVPTKLSPFQRWTHATITLHYKEFCYYLTSYIALEPPMLVEFCGLLRTIEGSRH
jgi:hypothetical protein